MAQGDALQKRKSGFESPLALSNTMPSAEYQREYRRKRMPGYARWTEKQRKGRRPRTAKHCLAGKPIGVHRNGVSLPPGDCECCGDGPLHGPRSVPGGTRCGCAFARAGKRLCRGCALFYDLLIDGHSHLPVPRERQEAILAMFDRFRKVEEFYECLGGTVSP